MKIYLVDDDASVCSILKIMIEQKSLGNVCGTASNGADALEDLPYLQPDIVVVDLLMPVMDGITFVKKARESFPDLCFVMLSQVSSKDMIAKAYECGVTFFIQKPVNGVEVVRVLTNVNDNLQLRRTFQQMQSLLGPASDISDIGDRYSGITESGASFSALGTSSCIQEERAHIKKLRITLQKLGITGEGGSTDIITLIDYMIEQGGNNKFSVSELCARFSPSNAKSMEQRIRRAVSAGLTNLANMGIEDYSNDTFHDYAGTLYSFEQIRKEMDCIRGKSLIHGKVSLKNFLNSLMFCCIS